MSISHSLIMARTAVFQTWLGDSAGAAATLAAGAPYIAKLRNSQPSGSIPVVLSEFAQQVPAVAAALERDDAVAAQHLASDAVSRLQAATPHGAEQERLRSFTLAISSHLVGQAEYRLGNFAAAEQAEHQALEERRHWGAQTISDQRDLNEMSTWLAMAQAREGRLAEAAATIAPVVKFQRELAARNHGDQWVPLELARALYAQSLTDPARREALLWEAAALVDGLAPTLQPLHDTRLWREWIRAAQRSAV